MTVNPPIAPPIIPDDPWKPLAIEPTPRFEIFGVYENEHVRQAIMALPRNAWEFQTEGSIWHVQPEYHSALENNLKNAKSKAQRESGEKIPFAARIFTRSQLAELPEPEPLIEGTIDKRTVALLAGYHGTGKTFISLSMAASIATGVSWLGRPVSQGKVLYVIGEGAYGINNRLKAWELENRVTIPDDSFHLYDRALQIATKKADREDLVLHLMGNDYALVVIDTLAKSNVGADENSAKDMGEFVDAVEEIKRAMQESAGTVLLIHHTGKDKSTVRGSSALEAGVDTVYSTEGDASRIVLKRTKRKDGPCHDQLQLALVEKGKSVVVRETAYITPQITAEHLTTAWTILSLSFAPGVPVPKSEMVRVLKGSGVSQSAAYRNIQTLREQGVLKLELVGASKKVENYSIDKEKALALGYHDTLADMPPEAPEYLTWESAS